MGKLCTLNEVMRVDRVDWYLPEAPYGTRRWPSPAFPHVVTIHYDTLYQATAKKIEIRKWIEEVLPPTTVVRTVIDKSYNRYWGPRKKYDEGHKQDNRWVAFYFEDEHSAALFRLRFSEWVKGISEKHPDDNDPIRSPEDDMPEMWPAHRDAEY